MKETLLSALLLASTLALPAAAQSIDGILVEPRNPTASDRIRLTVAGMEARGCALGFREPVYDNPSDTVVLRAAIPDCVATPIYQPFRRTFEIGPLPAGRHFAEVRFDGFLGFMWRELIDVAADTPKLVLGADDRFDVRVHWSNPHDGSSGTGFARRLAQDSGAFWFFSPDNLEVTVKILDGRPVNGRWWVFIASMTDLQLEVGISRAGGPARTYVQTAGANRNFIDVDASFEEGTQPVSGDLLPAPSIAIDPERPTVAEPVRIEVAVMNTEPDFAFVGRDGNRFVFNYNTYEYPSGAPLPPDRRFTAETTLGPLAPGVYSVDLQRDHDHLLGRTFEVGGPFTQLHLLDTAEGYFNVYVNLDPPFNGIGYGVPLTRESGYFWFFDPDNIELTVKILDGRAVNGRYWVFIASMTDVPFTVEVERCISHFDPFGCGSQFYQSTKGVNRNFIDVNFPGQ